MASLAASARIYFPSSGLAGADNGLSQARLLGQVLKTCPGFEIQVEGHSDPSGDPVINQRLSLQRAEAIVVRLAASGLDTTQFQAVGFGDTQPSNVTGTEPDEYYDRRVEFSVIEKTDAPMVASATNVWQQSQCVTDLQAKIDQTRIFYGAGSITVSADEMETVYQLAEQAAQCDGAFLRVIGQHADAPGTREGPSTGRLRALAIMNTLVSAGFEADQIIVSAPSWSVGIAGQPALPNSRVDFDIVENQG